MNNNNKDKKNLYFCTNLDWISKNFIAPIPEMRKKERIIKNTGAFNAELTNNEYISLI